MGAPKGPSNDNKSRSKLEHSRKNIRIAQKKEDNSKICFNNRGVILSVLRKVYGHTWHLETKIQSTQNRESEYYIVRSSFKSYRVANATALVDGT